MFVGEREGRSGCFKIQPQELRHRAHGRNIFVSWRPQYCMLTGHHRATKSLQLVRILVSLLAYLLV